MVTSNRLPFNIKLPRHKLLHACELDEEMIVLTLHLTFPEGGGEAKQTITRDRVSGVRINQDPGRSKRTRWRDVLLQREDGTYYTIKMAPRERIMVEVVAMQEDEE